MKTFYLFPLILTTIVSNFCCFNDCYAVEEKTVSLIDSIPQIEIKELDFEDLSKESQTGQLLEFVKENTNEQMALVQRRKGKKKKVLMHPLAEELAYINGQLCHVANYSQSVIYTVLSGPYTGTQTTMTYNGIILYVNHDYAMEYKRGGTVYHHYYSDSEVVTGSNQVIRFYSY